MGRRGKPADPFVADVIGANTRPDFFVVLTGLALHLPFAMDESRHSRFRTRPYLRRRLRRIVLPYYAALVFALLLPLALKLGYRVLGRAPNAEPFPAVGDLLAHLTFTHLFFPGYLEQHQRQPVDDVAGDAALHAVPSRRSCHQALGLPYDHSVRAGVDRMASGELVHWLCGLSVGERQPSGD